MFRRVRRNGRGDINNNLRKDDKKQFTKDHSEFKKLFGIVLKFYLFI